MPGQALYTAMLASKPRDVLAALAHCTTPVGFKLSCWPNQCANLYKNIWLAGGRFVAFGGAPKRDCFAPGRSNRQPDVDSAVTLGAVKFILFYLIKKNCFYVCSRCPHQ
jgi:hypothetical protein